ncbi:hypothetical protein H6775_02320 [Candidatus Nomurabacteria bacterium]|nr:hypothetical protein [Candidatus Nomurabacteria bacterium]
MWIEVLNESFQSVLAGVVSVLPNLIIAIVIVIIGWIVGAALSKVIEQILKSIKLDKALSTAGLHSLVEKSGFSLNSGKFIGELVKWFVIVVFLVAAFDVLGLSQVNDFLRGVVIGYLPQVIAAVLILLIAVVVAEAMRKVVSASAKAAGLMSANFLGSVTKWAIWIFAVLAALFQLGIAATFIQTLFTGAVVALALALGLAFGLGGKDAARDYVAKLRDEISDR